MRFKRTKFGVNELSLRLRKYSPTIDPSTGERVRAQSEIERYNCTISSAYSIRYNTISP